MAGTAHRWSRKLGRSVAERFWEKVVITETGCWEWIGSKTPKGYGLFAVATKHVVQVHVYAFTEWVGPVPPGHYVLHRCNNRACVNYEKCLYSGTQKQNMADREAAGNHVRGEASKRAKVTEEDVQEMLRSRAEGEKLGSIALRHGLHPAHVSRITRGLQWAHAQMI